MRLADSLPATLSESGPNLVATARTRLDPAWITEALEAAGAMTVRRRKLPFDVVVWLIIGANLMAGHAFDQVVRHLGLTPRTRRSTAQAPPSSGAVADARARLGDDALREVFRVTAAHWSADVRFDELRFHGLRVLAADGFALRTPDTASNAEEFGKPGSRRGEAAYPVVRAVGVIETGTHLAVDVELGSANTSELALVETLIGRLPGDSVTILDRNYDSVRHLHLLGDLSRQRHWLVRSKGRAKAKVAVALGVGDDLVDVEVGREVRRRHPDMPAAIRMRRIRYTAGRTEVTVLTP